MVETFIYKTVGDCEIALDVQLPDKQANNALPILIWFHGGGLLQGSRKIADPHLPRGASNGRYCLVTVDYRLSPQVSVADVMDDALDSVTFVREQLASKLKSGKIDPANIAVSGSSAGGYIALLLALRDPHLKSSLAIYPITDPTEAFFTTHQETKPYDLQKLKPFLDPSAAAVSLTEESSDRNRLYYYMLDQANLADLLSLDKAQKGDKSKYRVAEEIKQKGKSGNICPIFIVHGNADILVGVNQAYIVRDALVEQNLTHEFLEVEGADHGFDEDPAVTLEEMYTFMEKYWSR